jgi:hypothetical protein
MLLPARGTCPIGYGNVEDGRPDIGFFKVFLANLNTSASSLAQGSPFNESDGDRLVKPLDVPSVNWWATKKATVLQSVKK